MKTIRTVRQVVERDEHVLTEPKFKVGDYLEVYCGELEGHNFTVRDVLYNHDTRKFEYLYAGILMGGWYAENTVVRA